MSGLKRSKHSHQGQVRLAGGSDGPGLLDQRIEFLLEHRGKGKFRLKFRLDLKEHPGKFLPAALCACKPLHSATSEVMEHFSPEQTQALIADVSRLSKALDERGAQPQPAAAKGAA